MAEPWIGESASSSGGTRCRPRSVPRCGNRSLTHLPHWPYCLNFHFGPTTRPSFLCPPRPKVFTGIVLPSSVVQLRLVVERVDVAGPAVHEQEDDALRLGRRSAAASAPAGWPTSPRRRPRGGLPREEAVARRAGPVSARPVNPAPACQRNSRRVRPQNEPGGEAGIAIGHRRGSRRRWLVQSSVHELVQVQRHQAERLAGAAPAPIPSRPGERFDQVRRRASRPPRSGSRPVARRERQADLRRRVVARPRGGAGRPGRRPAR